MLKIGSRVRRNPEFWPVLTPHSVGTIVGKRGSHWLFLSDANKAGVLCEFTGKLVQPSPLPYLPSELQEIYS